MRIIEQSCEVLEPSGYDLGSIYKDIERAARVSYKSEDRITEDSAKPFVERLIKNNHLSCLEHGTVYLTIDYTDTPFNTMIQKYIHNPYSKVIDTAFKAYITTNMRVICENKWQDDLKYLCEPTEHHEKRVSVRFITSIAMSRELNRHRCNSIIEQSTRYCNYSKDKFGNEVTFIKPYWLEIHGEYTEDSELCLLAGQYDKNDIGLRFLASLMKSKSAYLTLLLKGCNPQQARDVLPLDTATELIHTAFVDDWYHLFELRCAPSAHPQMQALIKPLKEIFDNNKMQK